MCLDKLEFWGYENYFWDDLPWLEAECLISQVFKY